MYVYFTPKCMYQFFMHNQQKIPPKNPFQAALASSKGAFIGGVSILARPKVTSKVDALLTRHAEISAVLAVWKNALTLQ